MPKITLYQLDKGQVEIDTEDIRSIKPITLWESFEDREVVRRKPLFSTKRWQSYQACRLIMKNGDVRDVIETRFELDCRTELAKKKDEKW